VETMGGPIFSGVELTTSDLFYLNAATGWLELGNPSEARAELERISPPQRRHPDVLELEWAVAATQNDWPLALAPARELMDRAPERPSAWLHYSYALRRVPDGGLEAAWDALLPAAERFPQEPTIAYNLACYACQLGRVELARDWLRRAVHTGGKITIKAMALDDIDLEPLWAEIRDL
jgi:Flp pilus assembly protein TadD